MAYKNFKERDLISKLNLEFKSKELFEKINLFVISDWLKKTIQMTPQTINVSEKSISEFKVAPIFLEFISQNKGKVGLFSGVNLLADAQKGLNGECDFVLSLGDSILMAEKPIFTITEVKKLSIDEGIPQCVAQMFGSEIINNKYNASIKIIYGCVTDGDSWQFLMLQNNIVFKDTRRYSSINLPELLGVFQYILDSYYK